MISQALSRVAGTTPDPWELKRKGLLRPLALNCADPLSQCSTFQSVRYPLNRRRPPQSAQTPSISAVPLSRCGTHIIGKDPHSRCATPLSRCATPLVGSDFHSRCGTPFSVRYPSDGAVLPQSVRYPSDGADSHSRCGTPHSARQSHSVG